MSRLHIHVDASEISPELGSFLEKLGFWRSDFVEHGQHDGYEPAHHLTLKPQSTKEFREAFDTVVEWLEEHPGHIDGYLEGEVLPFDEEIEVRPFNSTIPIPFQLEKINLQPGRFRETEVHVALDRDRSHSDLRANLRRLGLFSAFLPKSYGVAEIFTVQGAQNHIDQLIPSLKQYIEEAGGAVNCSVKEERIARWWVSRPDVPLPPVVCNIKWL